MTLGGQPLVSHNFPYVPLTVAVQGGSLTIEALLDTGFDGEIVVPQYTFSPLLRPDYELEWALAGGIVVLAPAYVGTVVIGHFGPFNVAVSTMSLRGLLSRSTTASSLPSHGAVEPYSGRRSLMSHDGPKTRSARERSFSRSGPKRSGAWV